nr:hypothetical protein [Tanacetum cinerariifolium]
MGPVTTKLLVGTSSEGGSATETNESETPTPTHEGVSTNMMATYFVRDGLRRRDKKTDMLLTLLEEAATPSSNPEIRQLAIKDELGFVIHPDFGCINLRFPVL